MFPVPDVYITITFKIMDRDTHYEKVGQFLPSNTLEDAARFLEIDNFNDYRIVCRETPMYPTDKFLFFTHGQRMLTIFIIKKYSARTKQISRFKPIDSDSESDEVVTISFE